MFDTVEEANQKLAQTVIFYEDEPVYVSEAAGRRGAIKLNLMKIPHLSETLTVPLKDPKLNFRNLGGRIGYINVNEQFYREAIYSWRTHVRSARQTQGLSRANMRFTMIRGFPDEGIPGRSPVWEDMYRKDYGKDSLKGVYPSIEDASKSLFRDENPRFSTAIHRLYAFKRPKIGPVYFEYKGKDIGWTDDFHTIRLHEDYSHLGEDIESLGNLKVA